jgi:uncharacterized protein with HEPN domain
MKNDQVYLVHILEAIDKIEGFVHGITKFDFDQNDFVFIQEQVYWINKLNK